MSQPFLGLVSAPHTPFRADGDVGGAVAFDVVPALAAHLAATGVSAVYVAGATGEGASLSFAERRDLFDVWAEVGPPLGLRVIAQVGGECVRDSERLAEHVAGVAGVEALGAIAPRFYAPRSPDVVAQILARITAAAGGKPTYYYDIPALTGLPFGARELAEAFARHVPTLRGIKCSRYEGVHVLDYLRASDGRYDVLAGTDEALLSALVLGARGAVGSTYNFAAPLYLDLIAAFDAGDLVTARALQARSIALVQAIAPFGYLSASRLVMRRLGVDVGPARLPLAPLDAAAARALDAALDALRFDGGAEGGGFFEWAMGRRGAAQPGSAVGARA
ncbi:MAG: dihydrodipicolinate synthase family protein [Planctomycetota bacterium]